ncbi:uncharacterized protein LOC127240588 isoform X2 [Andrographis paniculata]|uniref:uncharacterized protein LOC127240588 isoform X2 n=1 Tax=Andrographis paniculata TaxID=175694 RepID=UPI0021E89ACE|nr:uncharacterized protein LOC127240588 isoform X2 [Andrographis paniculata]
MISHSYAADTFTKANELASSVAAALSPPQIASACSALESFLRKHTPDQQRWFFSITFPALICRLFGFDDSTPPKPRPCNGWIDVATSEKDLELAGRIFSLLSPNGVLLSSISAADQISLIKYIFPNERLPEWVRYMLQKQDCEVLGNMCPLFKGRVKGDPNQGSSYQVQLNVFEYYFFWFAFYPICRGTSEESEAAKAPQAKKSRLENWSYSIPGLSSSKRETEKKPESNLYARLLYAYLHSFVSVQDVNVYQPYRSSLLHYSPGYDSCAKDRAEFVINTLIHFWLVDNDFSPLPVSLCKAFGISFPFRSVLGETPPTPGLGDVINVFVKYLNLNIQTAMDGMNLIEYVGSAGWKLSGLFDVKSRDAAISIHSVISWNTLIQRPLYRFILRTFLFYPVETSIKNASQAFSAWINYLEPWSTNHEEFADLNESLGLAPKDSADSVPRSSSGYSSSCQGFVLANYLYYSSLVMHFIGFAHKFLHTDTEAIVQMVAKVISILTSSVELMDLIKNVDTVFHSKAVDSKKSVLSPVNRSIPIICQQLQDWEDGLCENEADGSFLHENWNKDLRLFANGEDGGQHLLQLFLLRAESELQAISVNTLSQNLQYLDSLKAQLSQLFGSPFTRQSPPMPGGSAAESGHHHQQSRDEIFKPRSFGHHNGAKIKYKGDWMKRPASNDEVAWLASLLVHISGLVNEKLGLNENQGRSSGSSYVELGVPDGSVHGPIETVKVVLWCVVCWLTWMRRSIAEFMRTHGLRVNLRLLASKKFVGLGQPKKMPNLLNMLRSMALEDGNLSPLSQG